MLETLATIHEALRSVGCGGHQRCEWLSKLGRAEFCRGLQGRAAEDQGGERGSKASFALTDHLFHRKGAPVLDIYWSSAFWPLLLSAFCSLYLWTFLFPTKTPNPFLPPYNSSDALMFFYSPMSLILPIYPQFFFTHYSLSPAIFISKCSLVCT